MKKVRNFLCVAIALILFAASLPIADFAIDANATNRRNVINTHNISGSDIVAQARKYLGVPYTDSDNHQFRTGYGTTMAFDCSGFVYRVCKDVGLTSSVANYSEGKDSNGNYYLTAHTQEQRYYGTDISNLIENVNKGDCSGLQAGDLLFFTSNNVTVSHVAIYSGNGTIIHSESAARCVAEHPVSRYPTSNNWYFAACRLITSNNTTNSEEKKLTKSSYPSHCTIKVTENDKNIMSLPCSNKTNSKSDKVESAPKGTTYEAIGLILNTEDNLWYKVKAKNGKEGYIFAGNVSFVSAITSDITGPGISVPSNHTHGKTYVLTGSVNSSYNELTNVSAYIYSGSNRITGGTASVNGKSYSLGRSAIDNQTEFNKLAVGQYTYKVTASYKSYYAKTDKTYGTKTGTVNVYSQAFNVVSGSVSPTVPQQPTTIIYPNNEGIYKIASGVGNNMYLDFACTSDNVQIYENCDGHSNSAFVISQYFKLTHIGDGWYSIINIGNRKAMDVYCANSKPETNIHQWEYDGNNAQLFRFYDAGNGYCYIQSKLGCYADVQNGDCVNNANVWTYIFNGSNAQKWKLEMHSHSYSSHITRIATCSQEGIRTYTCYCGESYTEAITKTTHTNRQEDNKCDLCGCILVQEPGTIIYPPNNSIVKIASLVGDNMYLDCDLNSINIQIYESHDGHSNINYVRSQYFLLTHAGEGWYSIVNIGNWKAVDVAGANPETYTNVQQWECYGNNAQLFRFYDAGNGCCYIKSMLGCYLDVTGSQNKNNTNVWMHLFNGATAQKWKIVDHNHTYSSKITTAATCTQTGIKTYECTICNSSYTKPIPKENHIYGNWSIKKIATCTTVGLQERKCTICNAIQKQDIAKKEHVFVDNRCQNCNFVKDSYYSKGDIDNDGKISASDARLTLRASVGLEKFNIELTKKADVDKDNKISAADARLILRASVGLENTKSWT